MSPHIHIKINAKSVKEKHMKTRKAKITYYEQYINDYGQIVETIKTLITDETKHIEFYKSAFNGLSLCGDYVRTYSIEYL
jgi:hypothetical protein